MLSGTDALQSSGNFVKMFCPYSLEPPHRGGSNEYPQSVLSRNIKKYISFFVVFFNLKLFIFGGKIFSIFEKACFRNVGANSFLLE